MLISKESIEEAKKYITQTDIDVLKNILIDDRWVMGHNYEKEYIQQAGAEEIRELMESELHEDYVYVGTALEGVGIEVKWEKEEDDEDEPEEFRRKFVGDGQKFR